MKPPHLKFSLNFTSTIHKATWPYICKCGGVLAYFYHREYVV